MWGDKRFAISGKKILNLWFALSNTAWQAKAPYPVRPRKQPPTLRVAPLIRIRIC